MSKNIIFYKRISLLVAFSLLAFGIFSALTMPKTEDPSIAKTGGMITIVYPGATPLEVEQNVVKPLEEELIEVALLEEIKTIVRSEVAIVGLRLDYNLSDKNEIVKTWDEVRRAIDRARKEFPESVREPTLNDNVLEKEAIVFGFTSNKLNITQLKSRVDQIKERFSQVNNIKRVNINSDPGEQVSINIEDEQILGLGLDYFQIKSQLLSSNLNVPAGSLQNENSSLLISTNSTFQSLSELTDFPLLLNSGEVIRLGQIAEVKMDRLLPKKTSMYLNGQEAIGLGLVLKESIDLIDYDKTFKRELEKIKKEFPEIDFHLISYFPSNVKSRILDLSKSLVIGVVSLGIVLMFFMGIRVGVLVGIIVPVITLISLGVFASFGGVLQQISISAFVMALGLLVDNVIVISESIQSKMNEGSDALEASRSTIKEFSLPLFAATGTTVASFIPMMLAQGPAGQFTRSLATVTVITLSVSYLFSIFITPLLTAGFLKAKKKKSLGFLDRISKGLGRVLSEKPKTVMLIVSIFLLMGMSTIPMLKVQFFPYADRDQLVIDVRLPEGTHFSKTEQISKQIIEEIKKSKLWNNEVLQIATYIGNSTPKFFYNLSLIPNSPHIAQMIVRVDHYSNSPRVRDELEKILEPLVTEGTLMVNELEQGPPVEAPVVVKVFSESFQDREKTINEIYAKLLTIKAATDIRHDLGAGIPKINYVINDTNAQKYGVSRSLITSVILGRTRGINAGEFRGSQNNIPILIRSSKGERIPIESIDNAFIRDSRSNIVSLFDVVDKELEFVPSSIGYERGRKLNKILVQAADGYGYGNILAELKPFIASLDTKAEVVLDGQGAESKKSNRQLIAGAPYALAVLILFLLIQFNSYKKFLIVFSSVPLSFIGLGPSHLLFGYPFGFFSLLGALALIGIIVNNAILLIEFIDIKLGEGLSIRSAIEETLMKRLKPIFLTTMTTIIGLLPLCFSDATLWPPFAWTIVFGLVLGSFLTIFFVPSLYTVLIFNKSKIDIRLGELKPTILTLVLLPIFPLSAQTLSLEQVISRAKEATSVRIAQQDLESVEASQNLQFRKAFFPSVGLQVERERFNEEQRLSTPIGNLPFFPQDRTVGGLVFNQKLFNLSQMYYERKKADAGVEATKLMKKRIVEIARYQTSVLYLKTLELEIKLKSLARFKVNLEKRKKEIKRLYSLGKVSELDILKITNAIDEASIGIDELESQIPSLRLAIGKSIGISKEIYPTQIKELSNYTIRDLKNEVSRPDLESLKNQIRATELGISEIEADYLPSLELEAREFYQDPSQFQSENWRSLAISLKWNLFERGTRQARKRIEVSKLTKLKLQKIDLERTIDIEKTKIRTLLSSRFKNIARRERNYQSGKRTLRLEEKRYGSGKSSLNDLIDAEILVKDLEENKDLSYIQYLKAYFEYLLVS